MQGLCGGCGAPVDTTDARTIVRTVGRVPSCAIRLADGEFWRGIVLPCLILLVAFYYFKTDSWPFRGRMFRSGGQVGKEIGKAASLPWAISLCGLALVAHAVYFWGRIEPFWKAAPIVAWIGGLVAFVSFLVAFWRALMVAMG
ncbi:MAG: hypothetical protein JNM94_11590 [Phycisphaerae bacterium]|nr:hypothetical protein [Phycisphaerae bacterium]